MESNWPHSLQARDAVSCSWVTNLGTLPPVDISPFLERSRSDQLALSAQLRERLHLLHLAPEQVNLFLHLPLLPAQVLEYLVSPKGRLGKTAGCFSLLASEQSRRRASSLVVSLQEGHSPGLRDFAAVARAGQQGTSSSPASSRPSCVFFWDSTPGRQASGALGRLQGEREQGREEAGTSGKGTKEAGYRQQGRAEANPGGKEEEDGAREREAQKEKKRRRSKVQEEKENQTEKKEQKTEGQGVSTSWRRSIVLAPRKSVL